jgi:hypothetical protein
MEAATTAAKEQGSVSVAGWIRHFALLERVAQAIGQPENFCQQLFAGQRSDGMVPADGTGVSGAVSVPVQGFLLARLLQANRQQSAALEPMLRLAFAKALDQHRYLYASRDPEENGLLVIRYPEEEGFGDNPAYHFAGEGAEQYQDPFFNACLSWSNEGLITLGHFLGEDVMEVVAWHELTIHTMNECLWDQDRGVYGAYDITGRRRIVLDTLATVLPLAAEVPTQEQAERMLEQLSGSAWGITGELCYRYPSCQPGASFADYSRGWRGPVWLVLNWMLHQGLVRYEFTAAAARLRRETLQLIAGYGFHDAYDARITAEDRNKGIGSPTSPSAASLALHWLLK